jgi:hypothetical protein
MSPWLSDRFVQFFIALFIVASLIALREAVTYDDVRLAAEAFLAMFAVPGLTYGLVAGATGIARTTGRITHRLDSLLESKAAAAEPPRIAGRPSSPPAGDREAARAWRETTRHDAPPATEDPS